MACALAATVNIRFLKIDEGSAKGRSWPVSDPPLRCADLVCDN
jgi:hypothetical protein